MKIDMQGQACDCQKGSFTETSVQDDMHGVLHCSACGIETNRWREIKPEEVSDQTHTFEEGMKSFFSRDVTTSLIGIVLFGFLGSILLMLSIFK